jgi:amino acid adenylation domain-containing protein
MRKAAAMAEPSPLTTTMLDSFRSQVRDNPGADALITSDDRLTYGALDRASDRWATTLYKRGVQPQDVVGVALPRSAVAISAAIGVLKARGVLLMIDSTHPPMRRARLTTEAGCAFVIDGETELSADDAPAPATPPYPGDAAYVVFTSGSTGAPKGVVCEHQSLANVVAAQRALLNVGTGDRVALIAPVSVDAFIMELTLGLTSGATVCFADEGQRHPGLPLRRFLRSASVTTLIATPTTLRSLVPEEHFTLQLVISAGESLDTELARQWAPGRRLVNHYGPTEATIWSTHAEICGNETEIPLGEPIPGVRVDVLRPDGSPADVGETGEIYLGGVGIARGYLNAPADNAFVTMAWGRAYRTGDWAVRRADGSLIFAGRRDDQVKLGGLRIELGEVRNHLLQHPAVEDAVIRMHAGRLVAYMTGPGIEGFNRDELILFMEDRLPMQLVPTTYIALSALPTTNWGKVDVAALPDPADVLLRPVEQVQMPRTPTQRYLVALARELTEISASVTDDLFMLGLNSILVARLIDRIDRDLGVELAPFDIFENSTIVALAERLDRSAPIAEPAP